MIIKSHLQHCDLLDNQQFIEIVLSQIIFQLCQGLKSSSIFFRCHMVYDWPTLLACDNATVPLKKSGRCQFQQPSFSGGSKDGTSHLIDLRYFSSVTIDGIISQRGRPSKVNLQPCGPNPLCSPPGSICGKGLQGMVANAIFHSYQMHEISNSRRVEVETP